MKKQRRNTGDVVRIELDGITHCYARVLEEALFAFYDCFMQKELAVEEVITCPVLFYVPVMNHAITKGRWQIVGHSPLSDALLSPPPRFMQDILNPDQFRLYEKGKSRKAIRQECVGLEREAVWDPVHVEDRLRDHLAGRPNKWVESLRMK